MEGKGKRKQQQNRDAVIKCRTLIKERTAAISEEHVVLWFRL